MIKAIYFYDGPIYMAVCKLDVPKDIKFKAIDAGMGTTYNLEQVIHFRFDSSEINILTNNPWLLSFDFCDTFYLFNFKTEKYRPIMEFTDKELRPAHNLCRMFVGGTFPDAKMIFSKPLS